MFCCGIARSIMFYSFLWTGILANQIKIYIAFIRKICYPFTKEKGKKGFL